MTNDAEPGLGYRDAQQALITRVTRIRIYGVPLEDKSKSDERTAIVWCGLQAGAINRRQCTDRIWHIPKRAILASGEVANFKCDGLQVHWFEVESTTTPIEERYDRVDLPSLVNVPVSPVTGHPIRPRNGHFPLPQGLAPDPDGLDRCLRACDDQFAQFFDFLQNRGYSEGAASDIAHDRLRDCQRYCRRVNGYDGYF
jgi:hypothetical protein